jgi:hypothetical protein
MIGGLAATGEEILCEMKYGCVIDVSTNGCVEVGFIHRT